MIEIAPRYLTKSRFKLALECPTKLYYTKKSEYPDKKLDNDFLAALANGGFQVGELAKYYFPGGVDITSLDYDTALNETNQLLSQENAIIYEAAFKYENLFIRADVVIKKGTTLEVFEVKAKSIDPINENIVNSRGIVPLWKPYVYDIAFQKHVISSAFPDFKIHAFLMLADKSKRASVDGLNQKFFLSKDEEGRKGIEVVGDVSIEALGEKILVAVPVDHIIDPILTSDSFSDQTDRSFVDWIAHYSEHYAKDIRISSSIGAHCNSCEFKASSIEEKEGLKNGFKECWRERAGFSEEDFYKPSILDVWYFTGKNSAIVEGRYFQSDFTREDFEPKTKSKTAEKAGLSRVDRQTLQIEKSNTNDNTHYLDIEGLKAEMQTWKFPLHFIDFETSAVAIPFNKGRRPYEQTAFQYSHHIVYEDGTIKHQGEWLNTEAGNFPNFNFVRALKAELENDDGTIFRYAAHENSILNAIYVQLRDSEEQDKDDLCNWIKTITKSSGTSSEKWEGERNMVDLCEMVKSYYYHPETKGSNSIKAVLPAILNSSVYLKEKYSKPIYGKEIISLNFKDKAWVEFDKEGKVIDPYKHLEAIFKDIDADLLDQFIADADAGLADGGAAMTAYAQMQFTQMSDEERQAIEKSLLKYCELDTLAMVMIWEGWNNI